MRNSTRTVAELRAHTLTTPHWRSEPQFRTDPIEVEEWGSPDGFLEGTAGHDAALAELEAMPQELQWAFWAVGACPEKRKPRLIQAWGLRGALAIWRLRQNALYRATEAALQADARAEADTYGDALRRSWKEEHERSAPLYEGDLSAITNVYGVQLDLTDVNQP